MHYELAQLLDGSRWLMEPKAFRGMIKRADAITLAEIQAAMTLHAQRESPVPRMVGDVAVIDVCGPITYKSSWFSYYFGGASIQDLQLQLRMALGDPAVRTIVFRYDTPGGVVDMVKEFAEEIFAARDQKPIYAVADLLIASAGYWLASAAETIYATDSSQLGSIGVYCEHDDLSGLLEKAGVKITLIAHGDHKVDGNPYEPLSDEAHADVQANVDEIGDWFDSAVARGRGVKKSVVLATFGQGKVFRGKEAIALGLADKLGTFGQVVGKLTKGRGAVTTSARASADIQDPVADAVSPPVTGTVARQSGDPVCTSCGRSSCACMEPECPPDCPTCSPECGCRQPAAKKAVTDVDDEHAVIIASTE